MKDWLDDHPQSGNPDAALICGMGKSLGRPIRIETINHIYHGFRNEIFPKLLNSPNLSADDKAKIQDLLKKPRNPYIRRHSALTEKSKILKEHVLRQHAGWSATSNMHQKYIHYYGNESNDCILEAYGVIDKSKKEVDKLKPIQCPNCNEPNKIDSGFCVRCRMILVYSEYMETMSQEEQKEKELQLLKDRNDINTAVIADLSDRYMKLMEDLLVLKQKGIDLPGCELQLG